MKYSIVRSLFLAILLCPLTVSTIDPNLALQSGSPAINGGVALTTVHSDDTGSGTSLVLADALYFQAGSAAATAPMGSSLSNVQGDWIAVGTVGNVTQITDINYSTNTATISPAITRSDGDSVWLYKKSDGVQVLYGSAPDYGAYEYNPTLICKMNNINAIGVRFN